MPRFRFSLRTLLLTTLVAGSGMLCWHVREAWAFKKWSMVEPGGGENPVHKYRNANFNEEACQRLSPTGRFFVVEEIDRENEQRLNAARKFVVLDLDTLNVVDHFDLDGDCHWHAAHDWLLVRKKKKPPSGPIMLRVSEDFDDTKTNDTPAKTPDAPTEKPIDSEIIAYPSNKVLFQSVYPLVFSGDTSLIKEWCDDKTVIYEADGFKKRFEINAPGRTDFVCDDRWIIRHEKKYNPKAKPYFTYTIERYDAKTGARGWSYQLPGECYRASVWSFTSDPTIIVQSVSMAAKRDDGTDIVWKKNDLHNLNVWGGRSNDFGYPSRSTRTEINAASGEGVSGEETTYRGESTVCYFDAPGVVSADKKLFLFVASGMRRIGIADATNAAKIHLSGVVQENNFAMYEPTAPDGELHSDLALTALHANGQHIFLPLGISRNNARVIATVDNSALGIWTRRRLHFEWWGMYEQPEVWLAAVLAGLFVWSVSQDRRDRR